MTTMSELWESFEPPDGCRAEYVGGRIVIQANPTTLQDAIARNIARQVPDGRALEAWQGRGIELHAESKPRADVVIARSEDIPMDARDWPAQIVEVVVEVVSGGRDAWKDDFLMKRSAYQEARIPRYLIVDPRGGSWHLMELDYSQATPVYEETGKGVFGKPIPLGVSDADGELVLQTDTWHPYPSSQR
ncbi:Uma2 family endonuclease [Streptacidiphilus sp. MAP5-3]|uniref:Uma2 family endonuclease n=1 Tax=unclassified Streptacidiphilus TaxID=2643834 RepID=UPI0035124582